MAERLHQICFKLENHPKPFSYSAGLGLSSTTLYSEGQGEDVRCQRSWVKIQTQTGPTNYHDKQNSLNLGNVSRTY